MTQHSVAIFLALVAAVTGGVGFSVVLRPLRDAISQRESAAEETLETRLANVGRNITRASELLVIMQTEIEARAEKARQLAADVKESEQLALLTQAQKDAIAAVFRSEIAAEGKRSIWWTVGVSVLSLVFGSSVTVLVTLLVHPMH